MDSAEFHAAVSTWTTTSMQAGLADYTGVPCRATVGIRRTARQISRRTSPLSVQNSPTKSNEL